MKPDPKVVNVPLKILGPISVKACFILSCLYENGECIYAADK